MPVLVVARVIQGFGAGAIPAVAYVSIGRALPEHLRPRMFATLSTAWVIPGVIGPSLAGVVAESLNWRLVFLGLLPLIAVAVALTLPAIRSVAPAPDAAEREHTVAEDARRRLPIAIVLVIGAALTVAGLSSFGPAPLVLIAVGLVIGTPSFARLTPPGTIRAARGLPAAVLLRGILTFAFFCTDAYVPLALQDWRGQPAIVSGVVFTAATLTWTGGAWIQAQRIERIGPRPFLATGFAVLAIGIVGFALILIPSVPLITAVVAWSVAGLAMGLAYAPTSLLMLQEASADRTGWASASLNLSDVLGTALGTGLGGAALVLASNQGWSISTGITVAFAFAGFGAVAGLAVSRRLPLKRAGRTIAAEPATEPAAAR
jgi:MFS family permease